MQKYTDGEFVKLNNSKSEKQYKIIRTFQSDIVISHNEEKKIYCNAGEIMIESIPEGNIQVVHSSQVTKL